MSISFLMIDSLIHNIIDTDDVSFVQCFTNSFVMLEVLLLYTVNIKRLLLVDNTRYGYAINIFLNNVVLTLK
jgi:hypothetical protein